MSMSLVFCSVVLHADHAEGDHHGLPVGCSSVVRALFRVRSAQALGTLRSPLLCTGVHGTTVPKGTLRLCSIPVIIVAVLHYGKTANMPSNASSRASSEPGQLPC